MTRHVDGISQRDGCAVAPSRRRRGQRAWQAGAAAEARAERSYAERGQTCLDRRWRGGSGEIDLVLRDGETYVFAEVKQAAAPGAAMARLRPAQMRRIHAAASEWLGRTPRGQLSDVRFDLVVVDGAGRCEILENAFSHF